MLLKRMNIQMLQYLFMPTTKVQLIVAIVSLINQLNEATAGKLHPKLLFSLSNTYQNK